jgi:hypothetical protein
MSYNKYNRCKNKQNWEIYRKQRNLVNKIKKQSIRNYFIERCAGVGFATTDLDNFKILEDIPSFPVAFFIPILLISLLTNSSLMGLKINWSD